MRHSAILFFAALSVAGKEPDIAALKNHTVKILVSSQLIGPGGQTGSLSTHGSGYLISEKYAVTNNHVCCRTERNGFKITSTALRVHTGRNTFTGARAVWASPDKDLAVLELEQPLQKPSAVFLAPAHVKDGSRVWAIGFPGAAESQAASPESNFAPVVTHGIIGKFVEKRLGQMSPLIHVIDHSAPVNPGNSGGPLFNVCGQVVGTNHAKAASAEVEGIYWAIDNKELLGELDRLQVPYKVDAQTCSESEENPQISTLMATQVGSIALGLVAIGLAMNKRVRQTVTKRLTTRRTVPDRQFPPSVLSSPRPYLRGVSGFYAGSSVQLEDSDWIIGRDSSVSNLVLPSEQGSVSKRHCSIRYDAASRKVFLEDTWSSNGTFLQNGTKLEPGRPYELRPGDRFYLAEPGCMFEIGNEG